MAGRAPRGNPFHQGEREAQRRWGVPGLWDGARIARLLWDRIPEEFHSRIEAAPFFFLATSDRRGRCDCSFKGGGPGLVRVLSAVRLAFPEFDGNSAFMSLGNILENAQVGLLFVDFADCARLRVNGRAAIRDGAAAAALFPSAPRAVVVDIDLVVPNCARHVPRLVPAPATESPRP